ncbi:hypothetical protein CDD83_6145 [Cordyceps sp. RAO-2017]|nr:hypothetical protein CDD83_6145 [Cordyceps sp. RAO-2017]
MTVQGGRAEALTADRSSYAPARDDKASEVIRGQSLWEAARKEQYRRTGLRAWVLERCERCDDMYDDPTVFCDSCGFS